MLRWLFFLPFVVSCAPSLETYAEAKRKALSGPGLQFEFAELFPEAKHSILRSAGVVTEWYSGAPLLGRYVLSMRIPGKLSFFGSFRSTGDPVFYINEITHIGTRNGRGEIRYGEQFEFGKAEWIKFLRNGGRIESLGFELKKESPVPRFAANWKSA